ncbi:MAG: SNF2-related protein [Rhodospirillaceae bacterium]
MARRVEASRADPSQDVRPVGRLTRENIRDAVTGNAFARAVEYQREGRVLEISIGDDGRRVAGRVHGSHWNPYVAHADLMDGADDEVEVWGECTCPVGANCKHVAAVLLEVLANRDDHAARARVTPAPADEPLDEELRAWVETLADLERSESEGYPPEIRQRLVYVLAYDRSAAHVPALTVQPTSVRLLKDDSLSEKTSLYNMAQVLHGTAARFLRPSDRAILRQLGARQSAAAGQGIPLTGEDMTATIAAIIGTGRARWHGAKGPAVLAGPPRRGRLHWRLGNDGALRPDVAIEGADGLRLVRADVPWYVDERTGAAGPVDTGVAPRVAAAMLAAPAVPGRQAERLRKVLAERAPAAAAVELPDVPPPEVVTATPTPTLHLTLREVPRNIFAVSAYGSPPPDPFAPDGRVAVARPAMRYGAFEIGLGDPRRQPTFSRDGRLVAVRRARKAERAAADRLDAIGFSAFELRHRYHGSAKDHRGDLVLEHLPRTPQWADVLYHDIPALRAEGWDVRIDPDFPLQLVLADGDLDAAFREGSGIDWFELDLGVEVDGERVDLVPAILRALAAHDAAADADPRGRARPYLLSLADGRTLAVPAARLAPMVAALRELFDAGAVDPQGGRIGFSSLDAAAAAALEHATADGVAWRGGERLREIGRLLRETGGIPHAAAPADFRATLRPYQQRGVDWLQFLRAAGLGGVLADDMGLGKTVQTLAHVAIEKAAGRLDRPVLVVSPTSVLNNWRSEAQRFAPHLSVLALHGLQRRDRFDDIARHDIVLTTYPLLSRDGDVLSEQPWHLVVLDEAQTIKNPDAVTTRFARQLDARHRLCLTGTPLENHLGELWSLFSFLAPGFLGDRAGFTRRWRTPIEKKGDAERRLLLARRVRPFLLRRTKAEVASDLPPKTEIVETVTMDDAQRDLYESIRLAMHKRVREAIAAQGLARSHIVVLDALLKLRQVCCDPRLLKLKAGEARKAGSAKLERLMEMLPPLVAEGRRVLLFSQFTSMLALIESEAYKADIPYVMLTGDTRDRATSIRRFQDGEVPLFLISLKAGGVGLNLTAADTVIHYDPWWNPAVEEQATDRAHRIGQDKPVFVHKLVMLDSIEEKMEVLKARKRDLAAGLFDPDAGTTLDLTESDVEALFAAG